MQFHDLGRLSATKDLEHLRLLGEPCYWASTVKLPYLSWSEAKTLLEELKEELD